MRRLVILGLSSVLFGGCGILGPDTETRIGDLYAYVSEDYASGRAAQARPQGRRGAGEAVPGGRVGDDPGADGAGGAGTRPGALPGGVSARGPEVAPLHLKFLARRGLVYREGQNWTGKHFAWLRAIQRDTVLETEDQVVFGEYLALLDYKLSRRDELDRQIEALALEPSYRKQWGHHGARLRRRGSGIHGCRPHSRRRMHQIP